MWVMFLWTTTAAEESRRRNVHLKSPSTTRSWQNTQNTAVYINTPRYKHIGQWGICPVLFWDIFPWVFLIISFCIFPSKHNITMGFAINQCDLCTGVLHQRVRIPLPESFMLPFSLIHMLPQQNIQKKKNLHLVLSTTSDHTFKFPSIYISLHSE